MRDTKRTELRIFALDIKFSKTSLAFSDDHGIPLLLSLLSKLRILFTMALNVFSFVHGSSLLPAPILTYRLENLIPT